MSDPQIWTLIGVFAASTFGMCGLISTMFIHVVKSEIGGLRGELKGDIATLRAEMNTKFDALDRDVQAIARRVFPD